MKKIIYIISFTILGLLVGFLLNAIIEFAVRDFINPVGPRFFLFLTFFGAIGLWQGVYWWRVLYVEKRYGRIKK